MGAAADLINAYAEVWSGARDGYSDSVGSVFDEPLESRPHKGAASAAAGPRVAEETNARGYKMGVWMDGRKQTHWTWCSALD